MVWLEIGCQDWDVENWITCGREVNNQLLQNISFDSSSNKIYKSIALNSLIDVFDSFATLIHIFLMENHIYFFTFANPIFFIKINSLTFHERFQFTDPD